MNAATSLFKPHMYPLRPLPSFIWSDRPSSHCSFILPMTSNLALYTDHTSSSAVFIWLSSTIFPPVLCIDFVALLFALNSRFCSRSRQVALRLLVYRLRVCSHLHSEVQHCLHPVVVCSLPSSPGLSSSGCFLSSGCLSSSSKALLSPSSLDASCLNLFLIHIQGFSPVFIQLLLVHRLLDHKLVVHRLFLSSSTILVSSSSRFASSSGSLFRLVLWLLIQACPLWPCHLRPQAYCSRA
ncbi:hypothetical protein B0T21DRAFT_42060 [Apiosordaria backusii]|uniref:Uncharacterized protein n=1 Tax=Apiosordaria backusii TaxID=314023 RepID=A0AA40E3I5_9PEZI|nr:hypothetical protein B0T21DRAFT_42060 [Apiosordaria backusii]